MLNKKDFYLFSRSTRSFHSLDHFRIPFAPKISDTMYQPKMPPKTMKSERPSGGLSTSQYKTHKNNGPYTKALPIIPPMRLFNKPLRSFLILA